VFHVHVPTVLKATTVLLPFVVTSGEQFAANELLIIVKFEINVVIKTIFTLVFNLIDK
jgi:hypothetical protein